MKANWCGLTSLSGSLMAISLEFRGAIIMHRPVKYFEKCLTYAAGAAWAVFERLNRIRPNPSFTPKWTDKPLLKSWEKTKPTLGWPRTTDSLCPKCVPQDRKSVV